MKKILSLFISVVLILSMVISVSAANPGAALKASANSVAVDGKVTLTLSLSSIDAATSAYVDITIPEGLEMLKGESKWLAEGLIKDISSSDASLALGSEKALNGNVLKLVFKGKTASADAKKISAAVQVKKGSKQVLKTTVTASVKVICKSHSYNDWKITKEATCTAKGSQSRSCSVCAFAETKAIAAKGHAYGADTVAKQATCTAKGVKTAICASCGATKNTDISALGHKYGNWETTKEATCAEGGTQTRKCATCNGVETKSIAVAGHKYGEAVIVNEPTENEPGLQKKTCTECGNVVEEEIPAIGIDSNANTITSSDSTISSDIEDVVSNIEIEEGNTTHVWVIWVIMGIIIVAIAIVVFIIDRNRKNK